MLTLFSLLYHPQPNLQNRSHIPATLYFIVRGPEELLESEDMGLGYSFRRSCAIPSYFSLPHFQTSPPIP